MAKKEGPSRARLSILVAIALGLVVLVFARLRSMPGLLAPPFASFAGCIVDANAWLPATAATAHLDLTRGSQPSTSLQALKLPAVPIASRQPIRGVVVDENGQAIAGAAIGIGAGRQIRSVATTNGDGTFSIERSVDDFKSWVDLHFSHPAHDDAQLWTQWGSSDLSITMRPRLPLEVRVVDADGKPFPVASVALRGFRSKAWEQEDEALLVADGTIWRGRLRRGANDVSVHLLPKDQAEWFEPSPCMVSAADPGPIVVDVQVRRAATRRVRVEDEAGQPIEAANLECIDPRGATMTVASHLAGLDGPNADGPLVRIEATTPRSGEVELRGPTGQPMLLRVRANNFAATLVEAVDFGAAEPLVLRLQAAARVLGQLSLATDAPRDAWRVRLGRPNGYTLGGGIRPVAVGADGTFELANVQLGAWIVILECKRGRSTSVTEGSVAQITLGPGENRVAIDLSSWRWSEVRARVHLDGSPPEHASLCLEREEPEVPDLLRSTLRVSLNAAGEFEGSLRPGRYRLGLFTAVLGLQFGPTVEIPDGTRGGGEVAWELGSGELELELVDEHGTPAREASLMLCNDPLQTFPHVARADAEGILRLRLLAGEWRPTWSAADPTRKWSGEEFIVRALANRRSLATLTVRAGETTKQRIVLPDAAIDRR